MLDQYRKNEGADQMDLFDYPELNSYRLWYLIGAACLFFSVAIIV